MENIPGSKPILTIALPAYNEGKVIASLLNRIQETMPTLGMETRVLVVNDGSADDTHAAAIAHPLAATDRMRILDHPKNMGLAAGVRTAVTTFLETAGPEDVLVVMDADDTHDPARIPGMLGLLAAGADIVIASRFRPGAREIGVSPLRRFFSRGVLLFMQLLAPVPGVRDYSCGYRAYRARALRDAAAAFGDTLIETAGFSVMSELLIKCAALGARVEEIPFVLRYDRKEGKSKIRFGNTIRGYLQLIAIHRAAYRKGRELRARG